MANNPTPPSIVITDEWLDLYVASGIGIGEPLLVTTRGQQSAYIAESAGSPASDIDGIEVYPTRTMLVDKASVGLWGRTAKAGVSTQVIVQLDEMAQ